MTVVGLQATGYILSMETLHFHVSRDVIYTLVLEALLAGILWAANQGILKIRAWFLNISMMQAELQKLRVQIMELRAEVVRSSTILPPPTVQRHDVTIPPSLPTINVANEDFVEGWEDDEDKTSSRT
jgi:hypothetical protein